MGRTNALSTAVPPLDADEDKAAAPRAAIRSVAVVAMAAGKKASRRRWSLLWLLQLLLLLVRRDAVAGEAVWRGVDRSIDRLVDL